MTSTSVTTVGGVMVVTQVIPQDEAAAIQLQTPAAAQQALPPATKATPTTPPPKVDDMTAIFLRGEPHVLGVIQIFVGLLCLLFSLTAVFSPSLVVHAPLCVAVCFLVSGSLAVSAARRTSVGRVWACLVSHLISLLIGLLTVAFVCWLLAYRRPSERFCDPENFDDFTPSESQTQECIGKMDLLDVSVFGPLGLLLVLLVLQVCVIVTVCVFSVRALRRRDNYVPFMVEVGDDSALLSGAPAALDGDDALLGSDETNTPPLNAP